MRLLKIRPRGLTVSLFFTFFLHPLSFFSFFPLLTSSLSREVCTCDLATCVSNSYRRTWSVWFVLRWPRGWALDGVTVVWSNDYCDSQVSADLEWKSLPQLPRAKLVCCGSRHWKENFIHVKSLCNPLTRVWMLLLEFLGFDEVQTAEDDCRQRQLYSVQLHDTFMVSE